MIRHHRKSTELGQSQYRHKEGEVEVVSQIEDFDRDQTVIIVTEEGEEIGGTHLERTKVVVEVMMEDKSVIIARKDTHRAEQIVQLWGDNAMHVVDTTISSAVQCAVDHRVE